MDTGLAIVPDMHGNAYWLDVALTDSVTQAVDLVVCWGEAIRGERSPPTRRGLSPFCRLCVR